MSQTERELAILEVTVADAYTLAQFGEVDAGRRCLLQELVRVTEAEERGEGWTRAFIARYREALNRYDADTNGPSGLGSDASDLDA